LISNLIIEKWAIYPEVASSLLLGKRVKRHAETDGSEIDADAVDADRAMVETFTLSFPPLHHPFSWGVSVVPLGCTYIDLG
jgi:hypothetical protein